MTTAFLTCVTPLTPRVLRLLDQCPHTSFIFMGCCPGLDFLGHLQVCFNTFVIRRLGVGNFNLPHMSFVIFLVIRILGRHFMNTWKAADRGVYHRPWPKSMLQLEDHLRVSGLNSQRSDSQPLLTSGLENTGPTSGLPGNQDVSHIYEIYRYACTQNPRALNTYIL